MVFLILFLTLVHGDINLREHSHFDDSSSGISVSFLAAAFLRYFSLKYI